jgi:SAM-dependent methyltransferase
MPDAYLRAPERRATPTTSPLDPDWLVQRHLLRDLRIALTAEARGVLLDVGCGARPYQPLLPAGVRSFGVDAAPAAGTRADAWALAGALPFSAGAFDTVLCTQVLEHLPNPAAALAEVARVLAPGGRLVLTAPQTWSLHEEPHDYWRFTRFGLNQLCRDAGLVPRRVVAEGGFFAVVGISLAFHLGSCARWAAERLLLARTIPAGSTTPTTPTAPAWRRWLAPLRLPLALVNLLCAALDALPHPGVFAVNHLVVAEKPAAARGRELP